MATKKSKETKYDSIILIPTDFSEVCGNAVIHGIHLARFLKYKAVILHVINNETKAALKKKNVGTDYVEKRLKEYKTYYEKKYDVVVDTIAEEGSIFSTINEVAGRIKANMMILGTHGKKGLQHVFGSYALRVVSESPLERQRLLVVPRMKNSRAALGFITLVAVSEKFARAGDSIPEKIFQAGL